jgi:A/G-specific adenine glycosylase
MPRIKGLDAVFRHAADPWPSSIKQTVNSKRLVTPQPAAAALINTPLQRGGRLRPAVRNRFNGFSRPAPTPRSLSALPPAATTRRVSALLRWFRRNARDLPWRRTSDPYAIWVSEIMLQQTQVKTVIRYWERWMRALPTLESLARAKPERIHKLWEGLGYYTRVRNLQRAAQIIVARYGGRFPDDFAEVLQLPGVGRYTAGAICSIAFNQPQPVLDGNVIRVLTRLYAIDGNARQPPVNARLWRLAEQLVRQAAGKAAAGNVRPRSHRQPATANSQRAASAADLSRRCSHLNQSLMELGATICTPRGARCGLCPVARFCAARRQDRVRQLPNLGARARTTQRRFLAFVARCQTRLLVRQRPPGVPNAGLWELPNVEVVHANPDLKQAAAVALGFTPAALEPLGSVKHSITRSRITIDVFTASVRGPRRLASPPGRWLTPSQWRRLPFAGPDLKILRHLRVKTGRAGRAELHQAPYRKI